MQAIGELDDEDANVRASGNEEFEQVVFGGGQVSGEILEVAIGFGEFGGAVDEEGDVFAEVGFDLGEGEIGIFDGVVEDAGDDGVFVHLPFLEDFLDGKGMGDKGFAG